MKLGPRRNYHKGRAAIRHEPVAEAADDGAGEELEEGEDGAEETAEEDGVELCGRAHAAAEPVHLDLERGEEAAAVMVAVV